MLALRDPHSAPHIAVRGLSTSVIGHVGATPELGAAVQDPLSSQPTVARQWTARLHAVAWAGSSAESPGKHTK